MSKTLEEKRLDKYNLDLVKVLTTQQMEDFKELFVPRKQAEQGVLKRKKISYLEGIFLAKYNEGYNQAIDDLKTLQDKEQP